MMRPFILGIAVLTSSACGMRSYVSAEDSKYPISMSSGLRDEKGKLLGDADLEKLGTLKVNYMACTMLWSAVGPGATFAFGSAAALVAAAVMLLGRGKVRRALTT